MAVDCCQKSSTKQFPKVNRVSLKVYGRKIVKTACRSNCESSSSTRIAKSYCCINTAWDDMSALTNFKKPSCSSADHSGIEFQVCGRVVFVFIVEREICVSHSLQTYLDWLRYILATELTAYLSRYSLGFDFKSDPA